MYATLATVATHRVSRPEGGDMSERSERIGWLSADANASAERSEGLT
jgi:hypothetical protein